MGCRCRTLVEMFGRSWVSVWAEVGVDIVNWWKCLGGGGVDIVYWGKCLGGVGYRYCELGEVFGGEWVLILYIGVGV